MTRRILPWITLSLLACGGAATPQAESAPAAPSSAPEPDRAEARAAAAATCPPPPEATCEAGDGSAASTLVRAKCLRESGHLIDALRDAQKALELGVQQRDAPTMKEARAEVRHDLEKISSVTFMAQDPEAWLVELDGRPVDLAAMKKYNVDPGFHFLTARHRATKASSSQSLCLAPGELKAIPITN